MARLDKHTMHSIGMRITPCRSSTPSPPSARPPPGLATYADLPVISGRLVV